MVLNYGAIYKEIVTGNFYKFTYSDNGRDGIVYCRTTDDFLILLKVWNGNSQKYTYNDLFPQWMNIEDVLEDNEFKMKVVSTCPISGVEYIQ